MRTPTSRVRSVSLPAASRLERSTSLVCLALALAVLTLVARIFSVV